MVPLELEFGMEDCLGDHDFFLMWVNWLSYFALGLTAQLPHFRRLSGCGILTRIIIVASLTE